MCAGNALFVQGGLAVNHQLVTLSLMRVEVVSGDYEVLVRP